MLKIVTKLSELNISQLKLVYEETINCLAKSTYADLHDNLQILNAEQDFYSDVNAFFCVKGAEYAVWVAEGRYISAIRLEPVDDGYLLTSFETIPAARGKGIGKKLLSAVVEHVAHLEETCIYSHVDEMNLPSLKVHLYCGFQSLGKPAVFVDGSVHKDHITYVFTKR